jgi:ElaA protein
VFLAFEQTVRKEEKRVIMNWKIKKFNDLTITELYDILKAREEIFVVEQDCPYHDIDSKDQDAVHIFLEEKGQVICYLRILDKGVRFDEVSISRVITRAAYRRKGYGDKLMEKAIDYIEEVMGEKKIRISAQAYLGKFYGDLGFIRVSDIYLEDGIDHYEMLYHNRS